MSLWARLMREAQRPGSVALAGIGTGLLAAGVVNPLLAVLAVPAFGAWGALLASRAFRTPDLRGEAVTQIEAALAQVAKLRYGAEHPPPADRKGMGREAARVRERFERMMAELDLARTQPQSDRDERARELSAEEFEERLRQFRRITQGEDAVLNRLRGSPSGILSLPVSLLADVAQLVNWAEAISRQRAEYLVTLTQQPIAPTLQRLEAKKRQIAQAGEAERAELQESLALLQSEIERYAELQREVRQIENQLDMIESLIRNLVLSTPNVPSAREQIARVKNNVETYQTVNRQVRERLEQRAANRIGQ